MISMFQRSALILMTATCLASAQPQSLDTLKQAAAEMVSGRAKLTQEIIDSVFAFSELGYQETNTSAYLTTLLEKNGFRITRGVAGLPTAWVAEWGSGKPVIGLMADIDGLPATSQTPGVAWHKPLIENGPGHGEGHNAGQAVNVTAALVVKELMERNGIQGTLRLYPGVAEELIGSRTYMVNAGLFKDLDVMLSSHIASEFGTTWGPAGSGLVSVEYTFTGRSAHGASPWAGRSRSRRRRADERRLELPARAPPHWSTARTMSSPMAAISPTSSPRWPRSGTTSANSNTRESKNSTRSDQPSPRQPR